MALKLIFLIISALLPGSKGQHNICSISTLTQASGNLTSPNYPSDYDNLLDCTAKIIAPEDKVIQVSFLNFNVEYSRECKFDDLKIYDGTVLHSSRGYCGTSPPHSFVAHNPNVTFRFKTDKSSTEKGFFIHWTTIARCACDEFTCWNGNCIPLTQHCDGTKHCTDDSDEIECAHSSSTFGECGKPDVAPQFLWDTRIVGGNEAVPGSWPWQVRLSITGGTTSNGCGGSILNSEWIVTAAHCTIDATSVKVDGGIHLLEKSAQQKRSIQIINHPDYHRTTLKNDIALIQLDSPLIFKSKLRPICLPENTATYDVSAGTICVATGWGKLDDEHGNPSTLHQVRLSIIDSATCGKAHSGLKSTQICAGDYEKGGVDTCQGDSGGPLVCLINDQTWYLIGITSFGGNCAAAQSPGVYTRVAEYNSWIKSHVPHLTTTTTASSNPHYPTSTTPPTVKRPCTTSTTTTTTTKSPSTTSTTTTTTKPPATTSTTPTSTKPPSTTSTTTTTTKPPSTTSTTTTTTKPPSTTSTTTTTSKPPSTTSTTTTTTKPPSTTSTTTTTTKPPSTTSTTPTSTKPPSTTSTMTTSSQPLFKSTPTTAKPSAHVNVQNIISQSQGTPGAAGVMKPTSSAQKIIAISHLMGFIIILILISAKFPLLQ